MEPLFILTFHVDKAFRVVNLQAPLDKLARTDMYVNGHERLSHFSSLKHR